MNIHQIMDDTFSGVISVIHHDQPLIQGSFGYADRPNMIKNQFNTRFGTASAGKVFVATAILHLIEQGKLSFDDTIGQLIPINWKKIDPAITVRQLLNHTSGIPDYFDESLLKNYEDLWINIPNYRIRTSSDLLPLFIDKPMMYPKGQRFQYNNSGYIVLGLIIEAITKKPFDVYLKETIFSPCEMNDTGYYDMDRLPARCAFSYIDDNDGIGYRTNIYSVDAKGTGAGGAFTTASDVENFWHALLEGKLMSKEMVVAMMSPQNERGTYGYGLWLLKGQVPSFQGCDPGANFITSYDIKNQLMVTILSNIDYDVETLHDKIVQFIHAV